MDEDEGLLAALIENTLSLKIVVEQAMVELYPNCRFRSHPTRLNAIKLKPGFNSYGLWH